MRWIVDRNKLSGGDLTALPGLGRMFRDPALNTNIINPGGTSYYELSASTQNSIQNSTITRLEASGILTRFKSYWIGTCRDQITGSDNPCVFGEKQYSRLPIDFGKDYSVEITTP